MARKTYEDSEKERLDNAYPLRSSSPQKRSDVDYEKKYNDLLKQYGLERKQSALEKDIAEYKSKLSPEVRNKLEGKSPIKVSQDKNGSAVAEVDEEKIKRTEDAATAKRMSYPSDRRDPDGRDVAADKRSVTKKNEDTSNKKAVANKTTKKSAVSVKKQESQSVVKPVSKDVKISSKLKDYYSKQNEAKEKNYSKGERLRILGRDFGENAVSNSVKNKARWKRLLSISSTSSAKPNTMAAARNEYQQELMRQHKEELKKLKK